ncbi:MAG: hypothetical protein IJT44_11380 [Clostridia bacterium]|nr:hypothetical protein [Clostridia bacterium]
MRILTEADLRSSLSLEGIKIYTVPPDVFITPAAREYLAVRGIGIAVKSGVKTCYDDTRRAETTSSVMHMFVDAKTGKTYDQKPEDMTHLRGNVLVKKTDPVIDFRGKLDLLESEIILAQIVSERLGYGQMTRDLGETLDFTRNILASEVLERPLDENDTLLGLTIPELRRVSHDIKSELGLKTHPMPDYTMGEMPAVLNKLRALVRQTELAAAKAVPDRVDIIRAMNRLSSCMHILFCRFLVGQYGSK